MPYNQQKYISILNMLFKKHGDKVLAIGAANYMRNQFKFYGLKTEVRRELSKQFINTIEQPNIKQLPSLVKELWKSPYRECHYFAQELLLKYKKQLTPDHIHLFEYLITHNSWWDTVDFIAPKLVGLVLKKHPDLQRSYTKKWLASKNTWLMRSAILFQMKYKKDTDVELLFTTIVKCANEKEFFIRKAIGWALREYSYVNPKSVATFVKNNKLSALSVKEALKAIKRDKLIQ